MEQSSSRSDSGQAFAMGDPPTNFLLLWTKLRLRLKDMRWLIPYWQRLCDGERIEFIFRQHPQRLGVPADLDRRAERPDRGLGNVDF